MLYSRLICHFIGNIAKWLFYFGRKPIDEVAKDDNSGLGFIIIVLILLISYSTK